ncbi:PLC-like phosphodiesterase [Amanita rubescens]|nr:PLC-like phosphodiesterase [Amanita rubescens]
MTGSPKTRMLPDCWGHRGASSRFPENTLASFEAAIRDGAEGIESDVHVSADDVVVMFHDPALERTTDSTGQIKERNWFGDGGMQHVRTRKEPRQPIPTFAETIELLMKPENHHVKFNVDVKVQNDPDRLFSLMNEIIAAQPDWQTALAPRILLGLWHPRFLDHAKARLPYCRRSYIGCSTDIARKYFWNDCDAFSIAFGALAAHDGQRFREECKNAGKNLMVWTVNKPAHMMEAVRWEVNAIITDATQIWLDLRSKLEVDYEGISSKYGRVFLWTTPRFYAPVLLQKSIASRRYLEGVAGPFDSFVREKVEAGTVLGLLRMYTPFKTIMT